MTKPRAEVLSKISGAALVSLNVAVIGFYVLWQIADSAAVARAEDAGFDGAQLLPNGNLLWMAAHASLFTMLVVDVLAITWYRRFRASKSALERSGTDRDCRTDGTSQDSVTQR